jgi:hypothetical protein
MTPEQVDKYARMAKSCRCCRRKFVESFCQQCNGIKTASLLSTLKLCEEAIEKAAEFIRNEYGKACVMSLRAALTAARKARGE